MNRSKHSSSRRKRLIVFAVAIVLVGAFVYFQFKTTEPSYQGKTLSRWISGLEYENVNPTLEQRDALRAMGEPAVRALIDLLERHDSALKRRFVRYAATHANIHNYWIAPRRIVPEDIYHAQAATALGEIGAAANAAIPVLTSLSNDPNDRISCRAKAALIKIQGLPITAEISILENPGATNWFDAALVAKYVGTNAAAAVPALVNALASTNSYVPEEAVQALGGIASAPEIAVPALIKIVEDPHQGYSIRRNAVDALAQFKSAKEKITPLFVSILQEPDNNLWLGVAFALEKWLTPEEKKTILVPALKKSLENRNETVRANAELFLKRIDSSQKR